MAAQHPEIVIVRRRGSHEGEHHGGAWKIAFADFMTAMMAFFLVLWIISATDKNTKTLIARYFNPVKVEEPAKAQKGIHGVPEKDAYQPGAGSAAPSAGRSTSERAESAAGSDGEAAPANASSEGSNGARQRRSRLSRPRIQQNPTRRCRSRNCSAIRARVSDKIAGAPPPGPRIDPSAALKGYGEVGPSADEALRDPFRPLGSDQAVNVVRSDTSAPPAASAAGDQPASAAASSAPEPPLAPSPSKAQAPQSPAPSSTYPPAPDAAEARRTAASNLLADLKKRLAGEASANQGPKLDVEATQDGILISLTDRRNFSMFAIGSAEPQPRVLRMMDAVAASLEGLPGAIIVRGHTDARPYRSATYDNWRLSSARAQMAYYMLSRGGLAEKRFERVEGYADRRLKDPSRPLAAENRRIEILLREAAP